MWLQIESFLPPLPPGTCYSIFGKVSCVSSLPPLPGHHKTRRHAMKVPRLCNTRNIGASSFIQVLRQPGVFKACELSRLKLRSSVLDKPHVHLPSRLLQKGQARIQQADGDWLSAGAGVRLRQSRAHQLLSAHPLPLQTAELQNVTQLLAACHFAFLMVLSSSRLSDLPGHFC